MPAPAAQPWFVSVPRALLVFPSLAASSCPWHPPCRGHWSWGPWDRLAGGGWWCPQKLLTSEVWGHQLNLCVLMPSRGTPPLSPNPLLLPASSPVGSKAVAMSSDDSAGHSFKGSYAFSGKTMPSG